MVDNFIRTSRGPRPGSVVNHRPDESVLYARRVISMSDLVQPRVEPGTPAPVHMQAPVAATKPAQPAPQTSQTSPAPQFRPTMDGMIARKVAKPVQPVAQPTRSFEVIHTDTVSTSVDPDGSYHSYEVDEVFVRIAAIESELPTVVRPTANPKTSGATGPHRPATRVKKEKTGSPLKRFKAKGDLLRYGGAALAAMFILALTGYVSIDTWVTNSEVKQVVAEKQETGGGMTLGEGEDETEVTPNAVDTYSVAADLPRVLTIDKLSVRARVLPMSVNPDGAMQAPVNIFDSGWYGASAKPGTPGATVIDAHASGATREGLFAYLDTLAAGDQLSVERGDGQKFTYEVTHTETVALGDVDMNKLLTPYGSAKEGLNLITCTGKWLPDQKTYDHRVMVYTKRV